MIRLKLRILLGGMGALLFVSSRVFAGGPLDLFAPGQFVAWDPGQPVNFVIDNGPLRPGISRDEAAEFIRETIQIWAEVQTATLTFEDRGFLPQDVTAQNAGQFLNQIAPQGNPIIFDADGQIIEDVIGMGASGTTLGFAAALACSSSFVAGAFSDCANHPGRDDRFYDYGRAVLNGRQATLDVNGIFHRTVLHEVGHMLGLDHSQIGLPDNPFLAQLPQCGTTFLDRRAAPIMFPIAFPGDTTLRRDDEVWLSFLYPTAEFSQMARIQGTISRRTGGVLSGANVTAVPVSVSNGVIQQQRDGRVSVVSDFLFSRNGSYLIPGLTPGDYVLFIERLCPDFTGGSRVGPFDLRFTDFPIDFYNGDNESGDENIDDPGEMTVISVGPGQTVEGINLISNETINQLDSLGDDDEEIFVFPEGFVFPFYGLRYGEVVVNSDGSLTFGSGDGFTGARDQMRLLIGPPRIAPLLSDLDPSAGGVVRAETTADSVTFVWDNVPEFSSSGARPGNTFSATLFSNGNIRFDYNSIDIIPDESSVLGVVGLSPGQLGSGQSTDLTSLASPIRFFDAPIFESFATEADFDLTGSSLTFSPEGTNFFLYFPYFVGDAVNFTGFALTNDEDAENLYQVEAFDESGQLQLFTVNPNRSRLEAGRQLALLGADLFGVSLQAEREGWVRIGLSRPKVASFFQLGNGLQGSISRLDGSVAFTDQSTVLYFTRLYDGPGSFPSLQGGQDATTLLALANPNEDAAITLTLRLFASGGQELAQATRQIPALGCLREALSSLFGQQQITDGFVRVDVDGPGAVGFQLISLGDTLLGFNASFGNPSENTSYSAQLANGNAGGLDIFTSAKLVNTSTSARQVTLTALDGAGQQLAVFGPMTLQPNESLQRDLGELFSLGPANGPATEGSLRVEADGAGIIGDVVFGDPNQLRFAAALPLQSQRLRRAIFSQVANAQTGRAAFSTFTGLAFHNPDSNQAAEITIRVFDAAGAETGSTLFELAAGGRTSRALTDFIPSTAGQVGGYIVVESTVPIVSQQLFGNFALTFLSAVPPTVFQ